MFFAEERKLSTLKGNIALLPHKTQERNTTTIKKSKHFSIILHPLLHIPIWNSFFINFLIKVCSFVPHIFINSCCPLHMLITPLSSLVISYFSCDAFESSVEEILLRVWFSHLISEVGCKWPFFSFLDTMMQMIF